MYDLNMDSGLPQTLMTTDRAACGLMRSGVHLCTRRLFPIRHFGEGIGNISISRRALSEILA